MRKLILSSVVVLTLAGCSASAAATSLGKPEASDVKSVVVTKSTNKQNALPNDVRQLTFLEKQARHKKQLLDNKNRVTAVLKKLKKTAGKTWYVFSGSSPSGWDCSGLVRWTYNQLGVELEHRASIQARSGKKVKTPTPGDIVAFYYPNSTSAYHVGIYLGNGKMINAPRPGTRTAIEPVHTYRLKGSKITYTQIIKQSPATS